MQTSSFQTYTGPGRICIARYAPRQTPGGYKMFKLLAPGDWFNKVSRERYLSLFKSEVLDKLDPQKTFDKLHELAGGAEPVLLCWEKPPLDDFNSPTAKNWCHRRIVAAWFEDNLKVHVPELGVMEQATLPGLR
jgi:hypothetical protein